MLLSKVNQTVIIYMTVGDTHQLQNKIKNNKLICIIPSSYNYVTLFYIFLSMTMFLFFYSPMAKFQITVGNRTMTMQKICQCPNLEIPIVVGNNLQTNVEMFAAHYSSGEKFFT